LNDSTATVNGFNGLAVSGIGATAFVMKSTLLGNALKDVNQAFGAVLRSAQNNTIYTLGGSWTPLSQF
jgi:hypothetical protein